MIFHATKNNLWKERDKNLLIPYLGLACLVVLVGGCVFTRDIYKGSAKLNYNLSLELTWPSPSISASMWEVEKKIARILEDIYDFFLCKILKFFCGCCEIIGKKKVELCKQFGKLIYFFSIFMIFSSLPPFPNIISCSSWR